jgi:hypothetical protein
MMNEEVKNLLADRFCRTCIYVAYSTEGTECMLDFFTIQEKISSNLEFFNLKNFPDISHTCKNYESSKNNIK